VTGKFRFPRFAMIANNPKQHLVESHALLAPESP
jgi:hypothetical protein